MSMSKRHKQSWIVGIILTVIGLELTVFGLRLPWWGRTEEQKEDFREANQILKEDLRGFIGWDNYKIDPIR